MCLFFLSLLLVSSIAAAPLLHADSLDVVHGSYIVVLKDGMTTAERDVHIQNIKDRISSSEEHASVGYVYNINGMLGFSAILTENLLKEEFAHPDVKYIEADRHISLDIQQQSSFISNPSQAVITQNGATWGLVRISQRQLNLSAPYIYNSNAGTGVDVYLLDSGIYTAHVDFGGRAKIGFNAFEPYETPQDINGHGTHNAGIIGGTVYGVAKQVTLYSVKVLGQGSGTIASAIAGVNYITNNKTNSRTPIASFSFTVTASTALDESVSKSISSGIYFVAPAGNDNNNACNFSPVRAGGLFVAGATSNTDSRTSFSNFGNCVSLFAPGLSITSDWIGSTTATNTISGTAMAASYAAGVLALQLSISSSRFPSFLLSQATPGVVSNPGAGSSNLLLFSPTN